MTRSKRPHGRRSRLQVQELRPSGIQRELSLLVAAGILTRRQSGNRVYLKADTGCPIFPDIQNLLTKTVGLVDVAILTQDGDECNPLLHRWWRP